MSCHGEILELPSLKASRKDSVLASPTVSVENASVAAEWNWVASKFLRATLGRAAAVVQAVVARLSSTRESAVLANFIVMVFIGLDTTRSTCTYWQEARPSTRCRQQAKKMDGLNGSSPLSIVEARQPKRSCFCCMMPTDVFSSRLKLERVSIGSDSATRLSPLLCCSFLSR